jgi:hypothetical protein
LVNKNKLKLANTKSITEAAYALLMQVQIGQLTGSFLMESAQCNMYTPEFSSHTKGLEISRKQKTVSILKRFFFYNVKCLINHSTFSIIYLSILSTLVVQQTI